MGAILCSSEVSLHCRLTVGLYKPLLPFPLPSLPPPPLPPRRMRVMLPHHRCVCYYWPCLTPVRSARPFRLSPPRWLWRPCMCCTTHSQLRWEDSLLVTWDRGQAIYLGWFCLSHCFACTLPATDERGQWCDAGWHAQHTVTTVSCSSSINLLQFTSFTSKHVFEDLTTNCLTFDPFFLQLHRRSCCPSLCAAGDCHARWASWQAGSCLSNLF